jgi:hypothetical protein
VYSLEDEPIVDMGNAATATTIGKNGHQPKVRDGYII